jgi:RNA polymerase sigma factor (sigma-70 family)
MSSSALAAGIRHLRRKLAGQQPNQDSDEQLLHAFLTRRDDNAFAALMHRHGPMVLHVCSRVLGHEQDAEDAFQATFLVLAQNAVALRNKASLASWLHGIAYRTAMKAKQSAVRRRKYEGQTFSRSPADPADELSWREVRTLLDEEIDRLPEKYRSVFVLCCLEDRSRAEAGQRLGLKERTVLSRLAEARKRLAQRLARRGVELTAALAATTLAAASASALPPGLMATTIKAALATAASDGLAGMVSASVAGLVRSAATTMMVSKAKIATMFLLTAVLLAGAGAWTCHTLATPQSAEQPAEPPANPSRTEQGHKAQTPQKEQKDRITVTGRVLGPDGKPVSGAKLFVPRRMPAESAPNLDVVLDAIAETIGKTQAIGKTDTEGRFRVAVPPPGRDVQNCLIAHASGFGVDWAELREDERPAEVTLRLVKDVPITGRVVNTEGRPVAGASLSIAEIYIPANEKLDDYLAGWLNNWRDNLSTPQKLLLVPLDSITGTATTDKNGRFALHGAGRDRIVSVKFSGSGMARETLHIITRPGFDAAPYNAVLPKEESKRHLGSNPFRRLDPPSLTFVAQRGKTIEGTVKDAASGKPLRCGVSVYIGWSEHIWTLTDTDGKYRLEGVPKNTKGYDVGASRPAYLFRRGHVADTAGFEKVKLDFALAKGAIVTGRVVDKQTGKGVKCGIRFAPLPDNKFFGSKPGFDNYRWNRAMEGTDKDGRFRLLTIPGKALVLVQVHEGEKLNGQHLCVYRGAVPDPDHKDIFKPTDDGWHVATAGGLEIFPGVENAVKVIDVKENGETKVELFVDRGTTARIAVQDAQGHPLAGAWASGLTDHWPIAYKLPEATAIVYALNPEKPRTMAFYHPEKKLGGTAIVRGDEKESVVVKLSPMGKVSGRLLDGDGHPLEGVEVSINPPEGSGSELYRFAAPSGKPVRTDKDGRFRIESVVPNLKFWLNSRRERIFFVGEPRIGVRQVKPGETLDLGALRVKPAQ